VTANRRTIVFFPEGAFGPTNNCVGIGTVLRERGHRVVFVIEDSFAGTLEAKGFEEARMRLQPPPQTEEDPGQFWKDFIRDTAPEFRKPTIEQLEGFLAPTWQALIDGALYVDHRLREIYEEARPDVVVEDNVVCFPALPASDVPWVRIVSCNPLELKDPGLPPVFSGYPTGDRSGWDAFWAEYDRVLGPIQERFSARVVERGCPPLSPREFIHESPFLNLYVYPREVDYPRSRQPATTWHRLDSSVRQDEERYRIPEGLDRAKGLVYLSLGSLGSADVALMQRLIDLLATTEYGVIVSKGPQHELLELADNMTGEEYLPQPSILPQVDVVITHGGNNTVTECLHYGRRVVVLPLFWDQYDNAQRLQEAGLGVRLPTYTFEDHELVGAIARLRDDRGLGDRLAAMSARVRAAAGTRQAADLIERVALTGRPVAS
jgi:MGT family glycosyltransferase